MTTQVKFEMIPGRNGGPSRAINPLTDIRQQVPPPEGQHLDMLKEMGYPFEGNDKGAFLASMISYTYFQLERAGVIAKLDWLYISTGDATGSVINLIPGKTNTAANGVTVDKGVIKTNGADSFFAADLAANAEHFTLNDACAFAYLTETPPGTAPTLPIIGNSDGNDVLRLNRNAGNPFTQLRLNSTSSASLDTPITADVWGPGLWMISRTDADTVHLHKDTDRITGSINSNANALATTAVVGRGGTDADVYTAQEFTAFGGGAALNDAERAALSAALNEHAAFIQTIS